MLQRILAPNIGVLNQFIGKLGGDPGTFFLMEPKYFFQLLFSMDLWRNIGWDSIIYLAAISGVDSALYEAASIDGATKWQQIKYVTIPHLKSMIIILFIMNVGKIFNADFGLFWNVPMNSGPLFPTTQVIDTYVYRALMATNNVGMSTAAGLLQNIVGFVCIMSANSLVRKFDEDSSLF